MPNEAASPGGWAAVLRARSRPCRAFRMQQEAWQGQARAAGQQRVQAQQAMQQQLLCHPGRAAGAGRARLLHRWQGQLRCKAHGSGVSSGLCWASLGPTAALLTGLGAGPGGEVMGMLYQTALEPMLLLLRLLA